MRTVSSRSWPSQAATVGRSTDSTWRRPVSWRNRCGWTLGTFARRPSSARMYSTPRAVYGPRLPRKMGPPACSGGMDRGRLLALGQLGLVLAEVAGGGLEQWHLVVVGEPAGEAPQVGQVEARGALATFVSLARKAKNSTSALSDENGDPWGAAIG